MYIATSYIVVNGTTSELLPIKSGFFKTIKQIDEFETIIAGLEKYNHKEPVIVRVIYRIHKSKHIPWI
jgi:hypothetical protein